MANENNLLASVAIQVKTLGSALWNIEVQLFIDIANSHTLMQHDEIIISNSDALTRWGIIETTPSIVYLHPETPAQHQPRPH